MLAPDGKITLYSVQICANLPRFYFYWLENEKEKSSWPAINPLAGMPQALLRVWSRAVTAGGGCRAAHCIFPSYATAGVASAREWGSRAGGGSYDGVGHGGIY